MSYILTLVTSENAPPLTDKHFKELANIIEHYNIRFTSKIIWLDKGKAADVCISNNAQSSLINHLRDALASDKIDFFITNNNNRQKKLVLADMDSTIAQGETLDELASFAGVKDKISEITALAMEGKLAFHEALKARVGLLKDLDANALDKTLAGIKLNKGADIFIKTMQKQDAVCILVSGGFTFFTNAIAQQCGFNFNHGNTMEIENGKLTGEIIPPILDKHAKVEILQKYMADNNLNESNCLSIGDGANDIPMLKKAGLGIGYHPKQAVKSEIGNCILYGDLTAALYAQGISSKYFQY